MSDDYAEYDFITPEPDVFVEGRVIFPSMKLTREMKKAYRRMGGRRRLRDRLLWWR